MQNISLFENGSGGSIDFRNNDIIYTDALYTAIYVKLFGGNINESTAKNNNVIDLHNDWWGNDIDSDPKEWINSETERTLRGIEITPRSLSEIERAILKDLSGLTEYGEIFSSVTMTGINRLKIEITIREKSGISKIAFTWANTKNESIEKRTL